MAKKEVDTQPEIEIEDQGKFLFVKLLKMSSKDYWEEQISEFNPVWKGLKKGWTVDKKHKSNLIMTLDLNNAEFEQNSDDEMKSNSEDEKDYSDEDESDSSTDDELIQKTLTRRILSESSGKTIELENVEDSEMEDVISVCRRFRHLYKEIKMLKDRVQELENKLK